MKICFDKKKNSLKLKLLISNLFNFQLKNIGISPDSISFNSVTMESSKYICIRETIQDKASVVIVDMATPTQPVRRSITADNAIMCPDQNILALKGMHFLKENTFSFFFFVYFFFK